MGDFLALKFRELSAAAMNTQFPINKHYSPEALWVVCGKLLICLNAGVCMLPLKSHGWLSACPYAAHTTPPPLPRAFTPYLSPLPPWLSNQCHAPAETDVWLDAIDKTTVWDGLPSQHAQLVRPSAVNHLIGDPPRGGKHSISHQ